MNKYKWNQYNNNKRLILNLIDFNKKKTVNAVEKGLYNQIRDIFCLSLILSLKSSKKNKINVLDFGSNHLAYSNIVNKIDCKKFSFNVYDPFYDKEKFSIPFKISFFNDFTVLKKNRWDMVNFGSSIQYLESLEVLENINLINTKVVSITHTPISLKKSYSAMQTNHKNLSQKIYSLKEIKKFFLKKNFKLIFKSRIDENLSAAKNKKDTYLLNLVFSK
jgi:hypothetical protein|tara:strand:+ start:42 stop:698 length:657 start_codon:yes stop_codon:yes gene_type:complete